MELFLDKKIGDIISSLKSEQRIRKFTSNELPKFVFVCGEQILNNDGTIRPKEELIRENNIRYYIMNKLEASKKTNKYGKENRQVKCVISEKLYNTDLADDILTFEEILAEISENIVIVVESPGSICELGAFVMNEKFIDKTVVLNENKQEYLKSFITLGPIKKIEGKNDGNVIWHNGKANIMNSLEVTRKIQEMVVSPVCIEPNDNQNDIDLKYLIYEFLNIIELFQPITAFEIIDVYMRIKNFTKYEIKNSKEHKVNTFKKVLRLMGDMDIIKNENGFYFIDENISCYNVLFTLERKEFNVLRMNYLSRVYKNEPERMKVS